MKITCCSFKKVEDAEKAIKDATKEAEKENMTIKDIKIIDRIADTKSGGILTAGMLIIMID